MGCGSAKRWPSSTSYVPAVYLPLYRRSEPAAQPGVWPVAIVRKSGDGAGCGPREAQCGRGQPGAAGGVRRLAIGGLDGGASADAIGTLFLVMISETKNSVADGIAIAAESLCATARWCYTQGWAPATSGNFSVREGVRILITASGLDKGTLGPAGLLEIDGDGRLLGGEGKPSAETGLHLVIYKAMLEARAILHVHTVWNTLLSGIHADAGYVQLADYELLKGLSGVSTHEHVERVPILSNSQDYAELSTQLAAALDQYPEAHGVLLSRHGLYTWGDSVAAARRHLEALEFLFEVEARRALGGQK
jgi:methylthioribulose-1-phosphate dehydratase